MHQQEHDQKVMTIRG